MTLVPNSPAKRLKWVRDTYGAKSPDAVLGTYEVALHLFGRERSASALAIFNVAVSLFSEGAVKSAMIELSNLDNSMPSRDENDFLLPWAARELSKLYTAKRKGEVDEETADLATNQIVKKGPAIAMWAKRERKDILKLSLAEALEAVAEVEVESKRSVPQGTVVFEYGDGWTMQELRGDEELAAGYDDGAGVEAGGHLPRLQDQLTAEGELMQHCVGSYAEAIERGESRIYSLRDPKGRPHVTLEWQASNPADWADWSADRFMNVHPRPMGAFVQIMGKQNDAPDKKYRPYVVRFIEEKFDREPVGLFLAGKEPAHIDFKRHGLDLFRRGLIVWEGADLHGADLSNMNLREVVFSGADLTDADLEGADARNADFSDTALGGADVSGMNVDGADMRQSDIVNAKNLSRLIWNVDTNFGMSQTERAEAFGVMWDREQEVFREVSWDPYARGYRWTDEIEAEEEAAKEDDEEASDDDEEVDVLQANPSESRVIAERMTTILSPHMSLDIAKDVANNAAGGVSDRVTPVQCIVQTIQLRLKHPGSTKAGPFPRLNAQQLTQITEAVRSDPAIQQAAIAVAEWWRKHDG